MLKKIVAIFFYTVVCFIFFAFGYGFFDATDLHGKCGRTHWFTQNWVPPLFMCGLLFISLVLKEIFYKEDITKECTCHEFVPYLQSGVCPRHGFIYIN